MIISLNFKDSCTKQELASEVSMAFQDNCQNQDACVLAPK